MKNNENGKVYLIGAGPGDPGLITVRGKELLYSCPAVVYDNLVSEELIVQISPDAESYYVGKKSGHHIMPQDEINQLLVDLARQGKNVARLKGSDPLIFGRGGEEAAFLQKHDIDFEIIPGVTAGIAAPAYVGIPCTDRERSSFVLFVTGHKATEKDRSSVPWEWVAGAESGTLVIYMGVHELRKISDRLIEGGYPPDTPAAAIERGTYPSQKTVTATLETLADEIKKADIKPPTIFIIGKVVELKETLNWMRHRPLAGLRVMVTRAADQAVPLYNSLRELGAEPLPYPTIATIENYDETGWASFGKIEGNNNWLVFTSENGVRYFFRQLCGQGADPRRIGGFRIAAVGHGTARALQEKGLTADFIPEGGGSEELCRGLIDKYGLKGSHVVRVRGNLADDIFENMAAGNGAKIHILTNYQTFHPDWPDGFREKLLERTPDAVLFTSGSTVEGLSHNLKTGEIDKIMERAKIFVLGKSAAMAVARAGWKVTAKAETHSMEGLVETLLNHFKID